MRIRFAALAILCGLLLANDAHANSFVFTKLQIVADIPANWRVDNEGESVTFSTKDKSVAISLAWAGKNLDEAWNILTKEVNKAVTGLKVTKRPGKIGLLQGFIGTGQGKLGKIDVHCYLSAVMAPGGAMTVFMLYPIGKDAPHKAAITQFFNGLAPAKAASIPNKR